MQDKNRIHKPDIETKLKKEEIHKNLQIEKKNKALVINNDIL